MTASSKPPRSASGPGPKRNSAVPACRPHPEVSISTNPEHPAAAVGTTASTPPPPRVARSLRRRRSGPPAPTPDESKAYGRSRQRQRVRTIAKATWGCSWSALTGVPAHDRLPPTVRRQRRRTAGGLSPAENAAIAADVVCRGPQSLRRRRLGIGESVALLSIVDLEESAAAWSRTGYDSGLSGLDASLPDPDA